MGAPTTPPEPLRRSWLDTFDWRLQRAGLELEQVERNGATSFELRTRERTRSGSVRHRADRLAGAGGRAPHWVSVRDRVAAVTGIRALLTTARFEGFRRTVPVLDDEDKTVARLHLDTAADDDDVTTARVTLSPLRGYDREAGRAGALLASLNGVTTAAASTYEHALAAAERDRRRRPRTPCRGHCRHAGRGGDRRRAPHVPRHRRSQRAGRARRHRHRVPARPSGRGSSRPLDREAGRRHPARRLRRHARARPGAFRPRSSSWRRI